MVEQCKCLGFAIDEAANSKGPESDEQTVTDISKDRTKTPRVLICQTDEQVSCYMHLALIYISLQRSTQLKNIITVRNGIPLH